jgi:CAAX prenyl protease-like protein
VVVIPYVVPFVLYLVLSQIPAKFPEQYAWLYPGVVVIVGGVTIGLLRGQRILRPHANVFPGVAVGLIGIALWIGLCHLNLEASLFGFLPNVLRPEARTGFNPFGQIYHPLGQWGFIAFRLVGLALLVPVLEELFWRGFLARWLVSAENWQQQKLGSFSPFSFTGVTLLFTVAHPEWLAAAVYCVLLNGLLYWKRDLWNCVVAHGVSNFVLGVYVLAAGRWELW